MDWIYFPIGDLPAEESDTRTPGRGTEFETARNALSAQGEVAERAKSPDGRERRCRTGLCVQTGFLPC